MLKEKKLTKGDQNKNRNRGNRERQRFGLRCCTHRGIEGASEQTFGGGKPLGVNFTAAKETKSAGARTSTGADGATPCWNLPTVGNQLTVYRR